MLCPKCHSDTKISGVYVDTNENERYRYYSCKNKECHYKFYSIEFIIENTEKLRERLKNIKRTR